MARTEPKTTPVDRSRLRRRWRRASSQNAATASTCSTKTPVTLTHDDGSEAEACTAAIHCAVRDVISSPRRTIDLAARDPREHALDRARGRLAARGGLRARRRSGSAAGSPRGTPPTSARSRAVSGPSASRAATADLVSLPYSIDAGVAPPRLAARSRRRAPTMPRVRASGAQIPVVHDSAPVELEPDRREAGPRGPREKPCRASAARASSPIGSVNASRSSLGHDAAPARPLRRPAARARERVAQLLLEARPGAAESQSYTGRTSAAASRAGAPSRRDPARSGRAGPRRRAARRCPASAPASGTTASARSRAS